MASYEFFPPRNELPEKTAAAIREGVAAQPDIAAVWWLTAVLHGDDGDEVAREELHFELAAPPDDDAPGSSALFKRLYRELTHTGIPPAGIHVCISSVRILPAVRAAALRVA